MITVACVLKSGGIYDASWVAKLEAGVRRHLKLPYRFACLSDVDVHCERIPLRHDWPRWWAKVEMFAPWNECLGRMLYLDLDTVIVGNIDEFAAYRGQACVTKDFYFGCPSQSVLNFAPGSMRHLWDAFMADPAAWMVDGDRCIAPHFGDQVLMTKVHGDKPIDFWQERLPGQLVSYKNDCRGWIPVGARMVCMHGRPKQCDFPPHHWVTENWCAPEMSSHA